MDEEKRIRELYDRSVSRSIFTYTDFLNESRQAEIKNYFASARDFSLQKTTIKSACENVTFWGGADFAERKIARFGSEKDIGYSEDFPLKIIKITLLGGKFCAPITHRDVLGAVMSLGVERDKVGDIFVADCAYVIVYDTVAEHVLQQLTSVGRNNVKAEIAAFVDESFASKTEEKSVSAQSNRIDAVVCKLFGIPREKAAELTEQGRLFIDGAPCAKCSRPLKTGETVSVRGFGKFKFIGENGKSKKGKTYFTVELYK